MCAPPENDEKSMKKQAEAGSRRSAAAYMRTKLSYHIHYNIEQGDFQAILRRGAVELFCSVLVILHTNKAAVRIHFRERAVPASIVTPIFVMQYSAVFSPLEGGRRQIVRCGKRF